MITLVNKMDKYKKITRVLIVILIVITATMGGLIYWKSKTISRKAEVVKKQVPSTEKKTVEEVSTSDISSITASSVLTDSLSTHYARLICDGNTSTAWTESVDGPGIGEFITIKFNGTYKMTNMRIYAGYQKTAVLYRANNRPKQITLTFSDGSQQVYTLTDQENAQTIKLDQAVDTQSVKITIDSVYKGTKYDDTCISEVELY